MKIKPIVIGLVACLIVPLAGANARSALDSGLNQAGAGTDLERNLVHTAGVFGRDDHCDDGDHGDNGNSGSAGNKDEGHHCHHRCNDGDRDDKGDKDDKNHQDCDKSKSRPH